MLNKLLAIPRFFTSRSRSYWIVVALTSGALPLLAAMVWLSLKHYSADGIQAMIDGRVAVVDIASGRVQGGLSSRSLPAITQAGKDSEGKEIMQPPLLPPPAKELRDAPALHISEETEGGLIPKIGEDGTKPWQYYARPFERKGNRPVIVILVTGVGLSKEVSDEALRLPPEMTLSVSPYTRAPAVWMASARALGHEVMIDLPMEPLGFPADDPGPKALLTMNNADEIDKHLRWILSRSTGYTGVAVSSRERFSTSPMAEGAYKFLGLHGLIMAHGASSVEDSVKKLAGKSSLPMLMADVRLDEELSSEAVQRQLQALENSARQNGVALGVTAAFPLTVSELSKWSEALEKKGFILAPVSALARMKNS